MTLADIIAQAHGRAGRWHVARNEGLGTATLYHYTTPMLTWHVSEPAYHVVQWDLGRGSVSDQAGMNQAFAILGLPYYYSRAGGAHVEPTHDPAPLRRWRKGRGLVTYTYAPKEV